MNKAEFQELCKNHRLLLDGATGSNLIKRGNMPSGVCPEKWILENPEVLIGLQEDYFKAGSNIVYAPTFTANRIKLEEYGLADRILEMNEELVGLSKEAIRRVESAGVPGPHFVAGDLTMTGQQLRPLGPLEVEDLIDVYKEQIQILEKAGVDLLVVETMMSLQECRCALIAAKEVSELPVMVTMTFESSGRALYGTDPVTALVTLQSLGADAFGVNCGAGPDQMYPLMESMIPYAKIPLICKPNAGLPTLLQDGSTGYTMNSKDFGNAMESILDLGVSLVGGCCGTAPEFLEEVKKLDTRMEYHPVFVENIQKSEQSEMPFYLLSSERQTVSFDLDSSFLIIGERINPTGKKALQAQLRENSFEMVRDFAQQQEEHGAKILDVNMGMSGVDEKEIMKKAIEEVTQVSNLPLSLDSSDVEVMELALRHYPGRALVNSVSFEEIKIKKMLPLVKKYGAAMILLPLSDEGLPKSLEEKKDIIHKVMDEAISIGLTKSDIIVDGLVATVGANKNAAVETIETIRYCRDELHLATACGLSNISFGLPERSFVNATFLTMAISAGLTMAIANPNQDLLANTAFACDLLRNKEGADIQYIQQISSRSEELSDEGAIISLYGGKKVFLNRMGNVSTSDTASVKKTTGMETTGSESVVFNEVEMKLYKGIMKGNRDGIVKMTEEAVKNGSLPQDLLNQVLLPAINQVGVLFDQGKYFLPQLIASAETMERSIGYLEPLLKAQSAEQKEKGSIVVATVEGDIHDIGKNLVVLMLKNHGYKVFDLGKDIPKEEIVEKALIERADIIALSALMTTTMKQMAEVVKYAKQCNCKSKIMIGGAVITQEYADEIGADGYSRDAAEAVRLANRLMGETEEK